jgi:hypothetical protein
MKRIALIAVLCLLAELAVASPVYLDYLDCEFEGEISKNKNFWLKNKFSLVVDGDNQEIVFTLEGIDGSFDIENSSFHPNEIRFVKILTEIRQETGPNIMYHYADKYVLNRTDLTIVNTYSEAVVLVDTDDLDNILDQDVKTWVGVCELVEVKETEI